MLMIQVLLQSGFQAFVPGERRHTELKKRKATQKFLEEPWDFTSLAHSVSELCIY